MEPLLKAIDTRPDASLQWHDLLWVKADIVVASQSTSISERQSLGMEGAGFGCGAILALVNEATGRGQTKGYIGVQA